MRSFAPNQHIVLPLCLLVTNSIVNGFTVQKTNTYRQQLLLHSTKSPPAKETQTLGLLTFDLDDTLYPIAKVEEEANQAFVKAMAKYGFDTENLKAGDIVASAQQIRDETSAVDPDAAAAMTHSELRLAAIRREMEKATVARKLQACADDWATPVDSLSTLVVENSRKYVQ